MKHQHQVTGTLESVTRMKSSENGNPRFKVVIDVAEVRENGRVLQQISNTAEDRFLMPAQTAVDSSIAYEVQNFEGKEVVATVAQHYGKTTLLDITPAVPVGAVTVHWMEDSTGKRGFFSTDINGTLDSARGYFMQDGGYLNIGDGEHDRVVRVLLVHKAGEPNNA